MTAIVASHGWRTGYAAIAAAILLVALPATWFLFRERAAVHDDSAAARAAAAAEAEGLTLGGAGRLPLLGDHRGVLPRVGRRHRADLQPGAAAD